MGIAGRQGAPFRRALDLPGRMKPHEWKKSFETGNAVIDAQHRKLVASLNNISTLIGEGKASRPSPGA